ncbi:MAG: hypothetical protein KF764_14945 [Labilithrix sp.]|nr:hypothetical protein [Labilithrix sp.]MBX3222513.1 hypothetical protein [Labilithrix sp.]
MSSSHPPPADRDASAPEGARGSTPDARRPRYLVVALVAALVFGAGCWTEGCGRLAFYRGEREHHAHLTSSIRDDADRAEAEGLYQRFVEIADDARGRAVPMAAATFVLGAALLALAARGLAGKSNTRSALMQVVAAQAIVVVASYFVTRDMWGAEADWQYESVVIHQRERLPPDEYQRSVPTLRAMRYWVPPGWLVFRTIASALIVVALSRPRSREFFEAASAPVSER